LELTKSSPREQEGSGSLFTSKQINLPASDRLL